MSAARQAGHMTCTRPQADRQIPLATRASSTHDSMTHKEKEQYKAEIAKLSDRLKTESRLGTEAANELQGTTFNLSLSAIMNRCAEHEGEPGPIPQEVLDRIGRHVYDRLFPEGLSHPDSPNRPAQDENARDTDPNAAPKRPSYDMPMV